MPPTVVILIINPNINVLYYVSCIWQTTVMDSSSVPRRTHMQYNGAVVMSAYPLRRYWPNIDRVEVAFIVPPSLPQSCATWSEISYAINTDIAAVYKIMKSDTVVGQNFSLIHQIDTYVMEMIAMQGNRRPFLSKSCYCCICCLLIFLASIIYIT